MVDLRSKAIKNKEYILITPKGDIFEGKNPITLVMLSDPPLINVLHETPVEETNPWPKYESNISSRRK